MGYKLTYSLFSIPKRHVFKKGLNAALEKSTLSDMVLGSPGQVPFPGKCSACSASDTGAAS